MTEDQIKYMVGRFLAWKLPGNFYPDGGISFTTVGNVGTEHEYRHEPSGTNLFDATQADAMVRHMLDGLPTNADLAVHHHPDNKRSPELDRLVDAAAVAFTQPTKDRT